MGGELRTVAIRDCREIRVYGRTTKDREPLTLFWTASGIEMKVKASEVWVEVESHYQIYEPWVSVLVNGAQVSRQMLVEGRYFICLVRNMNPDTEKTIRLMKDVQAMSADDAHCLQIHSIRLDGEFLPLEEKSMKLEFIGDSITSGEGTIGAKSEEDWISMFFGSAQGYATLTADALNADYRVISQSGWGVLSSWDNCPQCALPDYYSRVCGLAFGEKNAKLGAQEENDFRAWEPDVIVVNLGTNDGGAFNSPEWKDPVSGKVYKQRLLPDGSFHPEDLQKFEDKVTQFLGVLRFHNPDACILWAYGMLGTPMMPSIQRAVSAYMELTGDQKVFICELPENTEETVGSRSHPGPLNHRQAADVLVRKIRSILRDGQ